MKRILVWSLVAVPTLARAEAPPPPANAISIQPLAFASDAIAAEYERFLGHRFGAVVGPSLRWGAGGDYSSFQMGLGGELRWWILGTAPFDDWSARAMVGPFLALRLDLAWMTLSNDVQDRHVGSMLTIAESLWLGYRVSAWKRLEISALLGYAVRHEIDPDGRLAGYRRGAVGLGLTIGWLF